MSGHCAIVTLKQSLTYSCDSELLGQLVDIASSIPEGRGQLARAYFKLAVLQDEKERHGQGHTSKEMAESLRDELKPELQGAPFIEEEFMKLCVWMLW